MIQLKMSPPTETGCDQEMIYFFLSLETLLFCNYFMNSINNLEMMMSMWLELGRLNLHIYPHTSRDPMSPV